MKNVTDVKLTTDTVTVYTPPILPSTLPASAPTQPQPGVVATSPETASQGVGTLGNDASPEVLHMEEEGSEQALDDVDVPLSLLTSLEPTPTPPPEQLPLAVCRST